MMKKNTVTSIRKIFDKQTGEIDKIKAQLDEIYCNTTAENIYENIWKNIKQTLDIENTNLQKCELSIEAIFKVLPTWDDDNFQYRYKVLDDVLILNNLLQQDKF